MTKKPTILIVDDDDLLRSFYSRVLSTEGYEPVCAVNGEDAINILESGKHDFQLGIIDLLMPIRTGWELIMYMKKKEKFKNIPLIAVTGLAASLQEFEKVNSVCDAVMHKGELELSEFKAVIKKLVDKQAQGEPLPKSNGAEKRT